MQATKEIWDFTSGRDAPIVQRMQDLVVCFVVPGVNST
jgi:hypothetical protein